MRRAAFVLLLALACGCEDRGEARLAAEPRVLAARPPTPLDPQLEALFPLTTPWWEPGARVAPFTAAWQAGFVAHFLRTVDGWESIDGAWQARVSYRLPDGKSIEPWVVEWLRPEGTTLFVTRRLVAGQVQKLEPPQPWLIAPLEDGRAWTWEGRAGGTPARVELRVRRVPQWRGLTDLWAVDQTAQSGELSGTRTVYLRPGRGVVGEEGSYSDTPGNELTAFGG